MPLSCCWGKPIVNVVATISDLPLTEMLWGATGVTVTVGAKFSAQVSSVLLTPVLVLVTWSVQVPSADWPARLLSVAEPEV